MMTEVMLVEGVTDVQLISYYLQKLYDWKYEKSNKLGIVEMDKKDHIESLSKGENQLVLCSAGGNAKFANFVDRHRINDMFVERNIDTLMVVTDRDKDSIGKIARRINDALPDINIKAGKWTKNTISDSFGQPKCMDTYLLIVPPDKEGALESVLIDALKDIPEETELIQEVIKFIDSLKAGIVPELEKVNKADKATIGTYCSIRNPKDAMRFFSISISKIDWSKSAFLNKLFEPFKFFGEKKPTEDKE